MLYDIHNPLPRRRVVFDANLAMVAVDPGENRAGVELKDEEARRLMGLKDDIVVTRSAVAPAPAVEPQPQPQAQPSKPPQPQPQLGLPKTK